MNHESISWSHKPKISKTSIFHKLFFPKYGNFKIINTNTSVYLSRVKWVRLNKERTKFCKLCHKTLQLKFIFNIFFMKQYFLLNSNPAIIVRNIFQCQPLIMFKLSKYVYFYCNTNFCFWVIYFHKI